MFSLSVIQIRIKLTKCLFWVSAFTPALLFAQDTSNTKQCKWRVSILAEAIVFNNIKSDPIFNHEYTYAKVGPGYTIKADYNLSKRFAISSGINYFMLHYKANYKWIPAQTLDPLVPVEADVKVGFSQVPFHVKFSIIRRKKINFYLSGGIAATFLSSANENTLYANNSIRKMEYLNTFFLNPTAGAGILFNDNKGMGFIMEISYCKFSKGFDTFMAPKPEAISIGIGISSTINWKNFFKKHAWRPFPVCDD